MKRFIIVAIFSLLLTACSAQPLQTSQPSADKKIPEEEVENNSEDQTRTGENQGALEAETNTQALSAPTEEEIAALPERSSVILKTNKGDITIELLPKKSPRAAANFLNLVRAGFYNGIKFHRVIAGFMIQTGDPNSRDNNWLDDGMGGPGYYFADELGADDQLVRGTVAMANAGPNTNGSQFFIVTAESAPWLNGRYTIFGKVVQGMNTVTAIEQIRTNGQYGRPADHPLENAIILEAVIAE